MYVLDHIRTSTDGALTIAMYHRGHLSLKPNTTIYLAPVLRSERRGSTLPFPEILGTTVQRDAWRSVFRISLVLADRAGVVHQALRSIADHGGNVLHCDSTSTDQESHHNIEMVVDFAGKDSADPKAALVIEGALLADCAADVVLDDRDSYRVAVRPISSLRRTAELLDSARTSTHVDIVRTEHIGPDGRLRLDPMLMKLLQREGGRPLTPPFRYLVTSDTKDRVFRITFLPAESGALWCSVKHRDKPGALSAITNVLRSGGITLLCALNRVQQHQGVNWFEAVLSKGEWRSPKRGPGTPEAEVVGLLKQSKLRDQNLELDVFFDPRAASKAMAYPSDVIEQDLVRARPFNIRDWLQQAEKRSKQLETQISHSLGGANLDDDRVLRLKRENSVLRSGISKVRLATNRVRRTVFVSLQFTRASNRRIAIIENCCARFGLGVDIVTRPKHSPEVWPEIHNRITKATYFLGVWTPDRRNASKRASPWCLWELGLANALGLPFRILMQKGTEPKDYMQIHGHQFYCLFGNASDFRSRVNDAVRQLAAGKDGQHGGG